MMLLALRLTNSSPTLSLNKQPGSRDSIALAAKIRHYVKATISTFVRLRASESYQVVLMRFAASWECLIVGGNVSAIDADQERI